MPSLAFGSFGLAVALMSNSVRRLPLMRRPWEHVAYIAIGMYAGDCYARSRALTMERLAEAEAEYDAIVNKRIPKTLPSA